MSRPFIEFVNIDNRTVARLEADKTSMLIAKIVRFMESCDELVYDHHEVGNLEQS